MEKSCNTCRHADGYQCTNLVICEGEGQFPYWEKMPEHTPAGSLFGSKKANQTQVGGNHYQKAIQPWDYIVANNLGYLEGNVVKYVSRWKDKNGIEDLKKAQHYLQKLIETTGKE